MSMRKEFEVAFMADIVERHGQFSADQDGWLDRNSNGDYRSFRANGAWWGWQKSREALVVDLPDPSQTLAGPSLYAQFKESIEASGVAVRKSP